MTVEVVHGVEVSDPFRWLEDGADPAVEAWTRARDDEARQHLDGLGTRSTLRDRFDELLRVPVTRAPQVAGPWLFTLDRTGDADQPVLRVRPIIDPGAIPRVLVDPAAGVADATVALDWYHPSPDGALVAFGTSEGGDEQSSLRIVEVGTGELLDDVIARTRAASVAWLPDASAFGYTRYPDPAEVGADEANYHRALWWHVVGSDPTGDELLFGDDDMGDDRSAWPDVSASRDGRWLVIHVSRGWSRTDVHLIDRHSGIRTTVIEGVDARTGVEVVGDRLLGTTTLDAPKGRVISAPLTDPAAWTTEIPEGDTVLEGVVVAGQWLLVATSEVGVSHLQRAPFDPATTTVGDLEAVELPAVGTLGGIDADPARAEAFLAFESVAQPSSLWRWTPESGVTPWGPLTAGLSDPYVVEQATYPSTDGVEIPMFWVRRADVTPSAETPVVLAGYGGFAVAYGPSYSPLAAVVADAGGLFAVAGIRGGSEHGEEWHLAGTRANKQQVFEDFCAGADWLVDQGMTSRDRLAIRGGSNGGLLVAACLTQRPDLCRAVHCAVPLTDMVRYHRFLIARLWIPEYGDPDQPDDFAWLHAYSPYHHLVDGTCYPAVLVTTAEGDSRVDPAHARKFAARLAEATTCAQDRPVLLRTETRAGHGAGKPVSKQADELADVAAFLFDQLGVTLEG